MCRHAVWLGRPLPLSALTHDPPHALVVQSHRPKHMREATMNGDGWGAAWYPDDGRPEPVRYRVPTPAWSDENLASLAPRTLAGCLLATVRSATPGMPYGAMTNQPFVRGRLSFLHNGYLAPFPPIRRLLRARLDEDAEAMIHGNTDSEHVFALLWQTLAGRDDLESIAEAVAEIVRLCRRVALETGGKAYMNLVVANGSGFVATRSGTHGGGGSLFISEGAPGYEGGVAVASEPLTDAPAWLPVKDEVLIVAAHGEPVRQRPLV
jgi:ergothioneine biosynthesis protein EgtC